MTLKSVNKLPEISTRTSIILIVCASLCFSNSYNGDFVFDDSEAIVHNDDVKNTPLVDVFRNDFWGMKLSHKQSHKSYRPLTILTFRLQYWLRQGVLNSTDFHIVNILLHITVSVLSLFVFNVLLDSKRRVSCYAAILFAVHPVHTEAVAGIVGRADILCTLFIWLTILLYNHHIYCNNLFNKCISISLAIMCTAVAVLCKETGITAIGICAVYDILTINKIQPNCLVKLMTLKYRFQDVRKMLKIKRNGLLLRLSILLVSAMILIALRFSVMGFTPPTFQSVDNPTSFEESFIRRFINYNYIHALNVWLLFCPEWLCFDWSMGCVPLIRKFEMRIFAVLFYWLFLISLLWTAFSKENSQFARNIGIGLSILIIPFLPATNLFFKVGFVLAERTLYIPSAGFCILVVLGFEILYEHFPSPKMCLTLYISLTMIFFIRSWKRSDEWRNERSLFQSGVKVCPLNAKVHYNIAKNAADLGNVTYAEEEYREALRLNPEYAQAMNNLGNLMKNQGKFEQAEKLFMQAVELMEDFAAAWMNLGITLSSLKKYQDSEKSYMKALTYRTKYPDCYYNLGVLFMEQKLYQKALKAWETAIKQQNSHRRAWINMVLLLNDLGQTDVALQMGKNALIFIPNDAAMHFNIGNMLGKAGKFEEAEKYFQTALYYDSNNSVYYTNLGVLYHRWKRFEEARQMYDKALQLNPNSQSAKENLSKLKSKSR